MAGIVQVQWLLLCPLVEALPFLEPKRLAPVESSVGGMGSTNSPTESLGVIVSGAIPPFTLWFPDLCILPTGGTAPYDGH